MTTLLPEGVYIRLAEEDYFPQGRGSTDWSKLWRYKEGWWWQSNLNPDKREVSPTEDTQAAKRFGHALHKRACEGDEAYDTAFAILPEQKSFPGLCITANHLRAALERHGLKPLKSASKEDLQKMARMTLPETPIWDDILTAFEENLKKLDPKPVGLPGPDDRSVRLMVDALRADPEIGPLFQFAPDHIPLPEISVLYTDEFGIRRRARMDLMIPTVTIDVKTMIGSIAGKELKFAVPEIVAKQGYHIQMADHHLARKMAYRLIREGKVYGASEAEMVWLKRFPDEATHWGYAWIFYQKPDSVEGKAPIIFPWWEDYGDDLHRRGLRCLYEAIATYRQAMAKFGPDRPWTRVEPLHVTTEGNPDRVFVPHWIGGDTPLPNEEELLS